MQLVIRRKVVTASSIISQSFKLILTQNHPRAERINPIVPLTKLPFLHRDDEAMLHDDIGVLAGESKTD